MKHILNVEIAEEYGLEIGILIENFHFWILKNREENINYEDGYYWTYNTLVELSKIFPYWNRDQIHRALRKMVKEDLLIVSNYNKSSFDKTNWYTLTEKALDLLESPMWQKCEVDRAKTRNGYGKNTPPIPDINADINTDCLVVFEYYKNNFSKLDRGIEAELKRLVKRYGEDKLLRAMTIASSREKHLGYAKGILRNWKRREEKKDEKGDREEPKKGYGFGISI